MSIYFVNYDNNSAMYVAHHQKNETLHDAMNDLLWKKTAHDKNTFHNPHDRQSVKTVMPLAIRCNLCTIVLNFFSCEINFILK